MPGGPFACTKLYEPLRGLTAQVRRLARLAASPAAARRAVLVYALGLEDGNAFKLRVQQQLAG